MNVPLAHGARSRLVERTRSDGLGPQLVVLELIQISLHEATGLDGLERHYGIDIAATCGRRKREGG